MLCIVRVLLQTCCDILANFVLTSAVLRSFRTF